MDRQRESVSLRRRENEMHPVALQQLHSDPARAQPGGLVPSGRRTSTVADRNAPDWHPLSGFIRTTARVPGSQHNVQQGVQVRDLVLDDAWSRDQRIRGQQVPEGFYADEVENKKAGKRANEGNIKAQRISDHDDDRKRQRRDADRDVAARRVRRGREERRDRERQILEPVDPEEVRTMDEYRAELEADVVACRR